MKSGQVRGKHSSKSKSKTRMRLGSQKQITAVNDPDLKAFVDDRKHDEVTMDSKNVVNPIVNNVVETSEKACISIDDAPKFTSADEEASHVMGNNGVGLNIVGIEELFEKQLGIFTDAAEGGDSFVETQFTRKWGAVLSKESNESWSDVEFVKEEEEDDKFVKEVVKEEEDNDGFLVLDGDHGRERP